MDTAAAGAAGAGADGTVGGNGPATAGGAAVSAIWLSVRYRVSAASGQPEPAFAERAALLRRSSAQWLMGTGNPAPYELITGSGIPQLLRASLPLLRELVLERQRFVFLAPEIPERHLRTIGSALRPLEYILFDTLENQLQRIASGHYRGGPVRYRSWT
jgi:hypothetical protein